MVGVPSFFLLLSIPLCKCTTRFYLFILERGRQGEKEGKKHQCVVDSHVPFVGYLACNPGMCPDWESNQRPFGSQASAQSTEPHQPGLKDIFNSAGTLQYNMMF